MESVDVAVIGAGLAGLTVAKELARTGLRVVLCDRKQDLTGEIHTTGIFVRRTLESFEFPTGSLGPPVRRIALYSPGGRRFDLESPREEFRVGKMGPLYAEMLAQARAAGADWRAGWRLGGGERAGAGTRLAFDTPAGVRELDARFVIGCDGADSRVARLLGLEENSRFLAGVEEVHGSALPAGSEPIFHCFLEGRLAPGYIAWVVDDGEEVHVGTAGHARRYSPLQALEQFKATVRDRWPCAPETLRQKRGGKIPSGGVLRRIASDRGLLVGDAAGAVSPLTAGGLDPCLRMSRLAAVVAAGYLETGEAGVLADYDGRRFRSRFISRNLMRRCADLLAFNPALEVVHALLRSPPGRALAGHVFFGRGSFPDLDAPRVARAFAGR